MLIHHVSVFQQPDKGIYNFPETDLRLIPYATLYRNTLDNIFADEPNSYIITQTMIYPWFDFELYNRYEFTIKKEKSLSPLYPWSLENNASFDDFLQNWQIRNKPPVYYISNSYGDDDSSEKIPPVLKPMIEKIYTVSIDKPHSLMKNEVYRVRLP